MLKVIAPVIIFLVILLGFIFGFNISKDSPEIKPNEFGGTSLGLSYINAEGNQTIHKINKEPYTPQITVINHLSSKQKYRLFFFLDYNQINVSKDGKTMSSIDVTLKKNEQSIFNVHVDNKIKEGRHDFIVVLLRQPDFYLKENRYIPEDQFFMYRRVALFSGDTEYAASHIPFKIDYSTLPVIPTDNQFVQPIITTIETLDIGKNFISFVKKNSLIYINIINSEPGKKLAVVALTNRGQIPLKKNFLQVDKTGLLRYPLNVNDIQAPTNFYTITVEDPFISLTDEGVHSSHIVTFRP